MTTINSCPLCNNQSDIFYTENKKLYFQCRNCFGIFLSKRNLPDKNIEIKRYNEHNNDVNDLRYQKFVSPIVNSVIEYFSKKHKGLDFGAGTGPVISKLLHNKHFNIVQYDPFFHNFPDLLQYKYDYIISCEVIEHFHNPEKEFELLKNLLNLNGKLFCMTSLFNPNIDFKNWYYKNDPTHVFIYQKKTIQYICSRFKFSNVEISNNLIIFSN